MSAFTWTRIPAMPGRSTSRASGTIVAAAVDDLSEQMLRYVLGFIESNIGMDKAYEIIKAMQVHTDCEAGQKVVGVGSCGLDYLAVVARYPEPDTKLRTETLEVRAQ